MFRKVSTLMVSVIFLFVLSSCDFFSEEEDKVTQTKQLQTPTNISYDYENKLIRWNLVSNADYYIIYIDGKEEAQITSNKYNYDATKSFNVKVKASSNNQSTYSESVQSREYSYDFLDQVKNILVVDGILTWDSVPNAEGYQIKINGVEQSSLLTNNYFEGIVPGQSTSIFVRAVKSSTSNGGYISEYSNETVVRILEAPVLTFTKANKQITWNSISGAEGYDIKINKDGEFIFSTSLGVQTTSYIYEYTLAGTYEVFVQAKISTTDSYNSKYSNAYEIIRLDNPKWLELSDADKGVTNILFQDVQNADFYNVYVDDVNVNMTNRNSFEHSFDLLSTLEISHKVEIQSKSNLNHILDAVEPYEFLLTKLATPQNITINDGVIMWDDVNKASGYIVYIDGSKYEVSNTEINIPTFSAGIHTASVVARGNGSFIISSTPSPDYTIKKLNAPSNISIENYLIKWDSVFESTTYRVLIGDTLVQESSNNSFFIDPEFITTQSVIKIVAIGNGVNILDSDASNTQPITRLSAPTSLSTDNNNITWNEVVGADEYELHINNVVRVVKGTSFPWIDVTEGDKVIYVFALGNGSNLVTSKSSQTLAVKKLATPQFSDTTNVFNWNQVSGAFQYELTIGSQVFFVDKLNSSFEHKFTNSGSYHLKLRAVGDGISTVSSKYDTMIHSVTKLATPVGNPVFSVSKVDNQFLIGITNTVTNASGYEFSVGGVINESKTRTFAYDISSPGAYAIMVRATGDDFYYVDSNLSSSVTYTVLPTVTNVSFQYDMKDSYLLTWNAVNSATAYIVKVTKYDFNNNLVSTSSFTLTNFSLTIGTENVLTVQISITVVGNNLLTFNSSEYSNIFNVGGD